MLQKGAELLRRLVVLGFRSRYHHLEHIVNLLQGRLLQTRQHDRNVGFVDFVLVLVVSFDEKVTTRFVIQ